MIHVYHIRCAEATQVKARQEPTSNEHTFHACHSISIEITQIKTCQHAAAEEHVAHVYHVRCVEVLHAGDSSKVSHCRKPIVSHGGTGGGE